MNECAMVPATSSPYRRAASTFDVELNPTIALARATAIGRLAPVRAPEREVHQVRASGAAKR